MFEARHRLHQAVGHHEQRRLVHVSDEREQKELMAELAKNAALRIHEDGPRSVADDEER